MRKIFIISTSIFLFSGFVNSNEVIFGGVVNGNYFVNELNKAEQEIYVMGVLDGFYTADVFNPLAEGISSDVRPKILFKLHKCISSQIEDSLQLLAIVNKFVNENPSLWKQPMNLIVWQVVSDLCNLSE